MIYGNPNAKSESNGNAVFELFDVQGIVGFWHFDEPQWTGATGEVKDETGVNHGTAKNGATTTSDAKYGRAGLFDGSNDYVEVPDSDSLDITGEITIEAWVKILNLDTANRIVSKRQGMKSAYDFSFRGDASKQLNIFFCDGTNMDNLGSVPNVITDTLWHHVMVVRNDYNVEFFVDGESAGTVIAQYDMITLEYPVLIGCLGKAYSWFYGRIDEVRIYNRALTSTEIQILYNNYMQKMGSYFNVRKYVTPAPVVIV